MTTRTRSLLKRDLSIVMARGNLSDRLHVDSDRFGDSLKITVSF